MTTLYDFDGHDYIGFEKDTSFCRCFFHHYYLQLLINWPMTQAGPQKETSGNCWSYVLLQLKIFNGLLVLVWFL